MANNLYEDFSEEAIRFRSYLIWEREGCAHGAALDHWTRAKAELEAEYCAPPPLLKPGPMVMSRPRISNPPRRSIAFQISSARKIPAANAATQ